MSRSLATAGRGYADSIDHRVGRFEEALQIIHGLLRTGATDFEGQYCQARCELRPRGPRRTGPPILIGARADRPRSLRLTAQSMGHEPFVMGNGARAMGQHWAMRGESEIDEWYDDAGQWMGLRAVFPDKSIVEYRRL